MKSLQSCSVASGCVSEKRTWVCRSADAQRRESSLVLKSRARRGCAWGCTEWKGVRKKCQAKCFVSAFRRRKSEARVYTHTQTHTTANIMSIHKLQRSIDDNIPLSFSLYVTPKNINTNTLMTLTDTHALQNADGWRSNRGSLVDNMRHPTQRTEGEEMKEGSVWRVRKWPAEEEAGRRTVLIKQVRRKVKTWVAIISLRMHLNGFAQIICFQFDPRSLRLNTNIHGSFPQRDKKEETKNRVS